MKNSIKLLSISLGLLFLIFGVTKFFYHNFWLSYSSSILLKILFSFPVLFYIEAVLEILVGLSLIFSKYMKLSLHIAIMLLIAIIINLVIMHAYDIALRDLVILVLAYYLLKNN